MGIAERIYDALGVEALPRAARARYEAWNADLRAGIFRGLADEGYDRLGHLYRWRMRGMRARESSFFYRLWRRSLEALLETRVGDVGLWLLLSGLSLLILSLIRAHGGADPWELRVCALLILCAVPLVGGGSTLSRLFRESRLIGGRLLDFFELSSETLGVFSEGKARPLGVLLGSAAAVLVGALLTPQGLFLLLLLLPLLFLLLSVPEAAFLFFLAVFPAVYLSGHPTLLLCAAAFLLHLSYFLKAYCGRRDFFLELADLPVLLFCLLLLLGGLVGYGDAAEGVVLSLLASLYFPARHLLASVRMRRRARLVLLTGALLVSFLGIYQYFFTDAPLLWVDTERFAEIGSRVTGVFGNPNILGVYLLLLFPMSASAVPDGGESPALRLFSAFCALSILFCAVLTWSRGAWLAILAELFLLLLLGGRKTGTLTLLSPLLLPAAFPFLPHGVLHRFASIASLTDSSTRYRLYTWRGVLRMIGEHPFGIGVGETAFHRIYPRYALSGIETVMHAHQMPLQLTAEMGGIGAVTFYAGILFLVMRGLGGRVAYGAPFALCGAAVMGLFDHLWYAKGMIALLFIVAAFSVEGRGCECA